MKALLILSVLLAGVLAATAAAVAAAEAAPQKLHEDNQLVEKEAADFVPEVAAAEAAPQELQEDNQLVEKEAADFVPEAIESEGEFSAGEVASSPQGRFFSCPSGWVRYKSDCYQFVASSRSWSSAVTNCASYGASLASAHDLFDYSFLQELTSRSGYTTAWMGGFYFQTWRWLDQSSFSYSNWHSQSSVSSRQCIYLNARAGWSNNVCTTSYPYICVKKTDC